MFSLEQYCNNLEQFIKTVIERPERDNLTYDLLDDEFTIENYKIALKIKHFQMKKGEIWQEAIGSYDGFTNLKIGHDTGLDILSDKYKIAIELKNRTNTDNYSSKKQNLNKLAEFKLSNPSYRCIYATINDSTETKTINGSNKIINHNDVEIENIVGYAFLRLIFENNTEFIVNFIKLTIKKYLQY